MEASGRLPTSVGDIMTRQLITVRPDASVEQAMRMMRKHGISSVLMEPGVDGEWGIMTQRDVVSQIVNENRSPADVHVEDIASRPLIMVASHTSLSDCSSQMMKANIRRVVVEQQGVPVGIVSDTDIFRVVDEHGWVHA